MKAELLQMRAQGGNTLRWRRGTDRRTALPTDNLCTEAPRPIGLCALRSGDAGDCQSDSMHVQHPAQVTRYTLLDIVNDVDKFG
jgi:hypothetical protein